MKQVINLLHKERAKIEKTLPFDQQMADENRGSEEVQIMRRKSIKEDYAFLRQINQAILILNKHTS